MRDNQDNGDDFTPSSAENERKLANVDRKICVCSRSEVFLSVDYDVGTHVQRTRPVDRISHRKWRETKEQLI